ncbi:hypothetical protein ASZ90_002295 [hydrocarbon metagenome]|uniref:Uncharacterized protein n=1 Tax=hydrocarbon metagenome TaxID=938273 RepID=A0A0W8G3W3_9ZZZZ
MTAIGTGTSPGRFPAISGDRRPGGRLDERRRVAHPWSRS